MQSETWADGGNHFVRLLSACEEVIWTGSEVIGQWNTHLNAGISGDVSVDIPQPSRDQSDQGMP